MSKLVSLDELARLIPDGASIALGGSFLHRAPAAVARALVSRGARDLELVKPSPGYDLDVLCRGGALRRARIGIAAMDAELGLLPAYRRAVESKAIELEEHSCITIVSGFRASAYGVPFLPVAGLDGSDIPALNGWIQMRDPYGSDRSVYVVPAIRPDVVVVHVNEVDEEGNARLYGSPQWDRIMTRAAERVLVTAEQVVPRERIEAQPELTLVPGFMVEAVAIAPRGAWPGSMYPEYGIDFAAVERYLEFDDDALTRHLAEAPEAGSLLRAS
jgi:glutaconate CoA-transferase, subunit A